MSVASVQGLPPRGAPRLAGKRVLLLGAGSVGEGIGNGRAMAILFAREGAQVACVDLNLAAAEETTALIAAEGGQAVALSADVTQENEIARIVAATLAAFGRIDILVNNVGGSVPGGPEEMSPEVWHKQFHHNLHYVHLSTRAVLPVMVQQGGGAIVNLSSVAALRNIGPDLMAYAASKSGVMALSRMIAVRYAPQGIRCNVVIPGLMHTPLVEARLAGQRSGGDVSAIVARRNAQPPMGRMGDAWDVAYAALYLASDEAKYVTGAEIVVDGGLTLKTP
ncbi:SDR family NAD(P)-dependent oxidoreductase [Sediminicoccus rosea]|jgi:NAD(P)-dependent dehydrogenase (short-subunit alcohol dehydrogenase family)|uniref:SDR family NAD(P)-dependent oxidoreductase n=1 Tax=Sediminicoccus rosea TaxID=1225128 RepID=A0ABZ0PGH0_9PROT|nr:SDR family NAD(P)-dependent oxidoreductase [Sediminicoccus rosea]WPB84744.1 SDR family NAD(P)-dependent oxidoreductase [Sediminicoccus rosea]